MHKINIVSSQAVLKMSSFSMDTRSMSSSPLVNSLVTNRLFKTASDIDEPPFQFIHTMNLSVVNTMLHDIPDLAVHRTDIWAVWRTQIERKKVKRFLTQQFNCCTCAVRCAGSSMMSLWRRETASKKSVSLTDITVISCFIIAMNLPHALQIYSTVFVKKCMQWVQWCSGRVSDS